MKFLKKIIAVIFIGSFYYTTMIIYEVVNEKYYNSTNLFRHIIISLIVGGGIVFIAPIFGDYISKLAKRKRGKDL